MNGFDERGLYDIYSVWHVPFWQTASFFWTITALITILILALLYVLYSWYKKRTIKQLTPWEKALQIIADLEKQTYETKEEGKKCYFALTTALKNYFEQRYGIPISKKTDEEASKILEDQSLQKDIKKGLQEIFQGCLLIKFANEQAMEEQIRKHLKEAAAIVKQSVPKPQA